MSAKKQTYNNQRRKNNKSVSPNEKSKRLYLLPVVFILAILPLIIRYKEYDTFLSGYQWFSSASKFTDFFLYYKQSFFIGISVLMIIIIAFKAFMDKRSFKFSPVFVPLAVYAALALLSSVFSKYSSFSYRGIFEQFESVFVILGYCLVAYYIYLFIETERDVRFVIKGLLFCVLVFGIIGFTQIINHDFFASDIGLKLITPSSFWNSLDSFSFTMGEKTIYLTLYNPNYVGVYVSLVAPLVFILLLYSKKDKSALVYLLGFIGLIICLIGSHSDTGVVALIAGSLFALLLSWRYLLKYIKVALPLLCIIAIATSFYIGTHEDTILTKIKQVTRLEAVTPNLTEIQTDENLAIKYCNNTLKVQFEVVSDTTPIITLLDETGQPVPYTYNETNGSYAITDGRFSGFVVTPYNFGTELGFGILIDGKEWLFTNQTEDGTFYFYNPYGKLDKMITAPSAIFTKYGNFASGRGYIWSRTIPLLKDRIILGSGADTFALVYPHDDYVNLNNYGFGSQLLTKPHSLYLQMGVQTGVLSLLAFLIFYGMYFISSLRIYIKGRFNSYYSQVGVGIFIGTVCYMICGIANDSSISVAPVFWVLIGLGIAINHKVRPLIEEEQLLAKAAKAKNE